MPASLASYEDLVTWSDRPVGNVARAEAILVAASNLVRTYKGGSWLEVDTPDVSEVALGAARTVVLNVAYRTYHNPAGKNRDQSGPFSSAVESWSALGCALSDQDIAQLASATPFRGLGVIETTRGRVETPSVRW